MSSAAYLRVSTEEQRERQTIETQRHFAERWFDQRGIAPVRYYVDDGVSGTIPLEERPEGVRLLADARAGVVKHVFVYKIDRLGRDPLVTMQAASDLKRAGAALQSMTETVDLETPHGRLSMVMLCGVAGYERDSLVARSIEGSNRLARAGAWLGGIVPFGYRVEGRGQHARLVVADDPIPGIGMGEADVVRLVFRLCADERLSSLKIADRLNDLGVPTAYQRDDRKPTRGKRKQRTAGVWRAGRVRNLIVSTTYKGLHQYGKRSTRQRELIERAVPPIVDEATWDRAQETLRRNAKWSRRNGRRDYLLRGLITCGTCGLTYSGSAYPVRGGEMRTFYICNGRSQPNRALGRLGHKCPSATVPGTIEGLVWGDIVGFAANAEDTIQELHRSAGPPEQRLAASRERAAALRAARDGVAVQRERVLALYRRGVIDEATVERQLAEVAAEESGVASELAAVEAAIDEARAEDDLVKAAEMAIYRLRRRLDEIDGPLDHATKRAFVEDLVSGIVVTSKEVDGRPETVVQVTYNFTPIGACTGTDSWPQSA
jgi:site-specific DNA recombinase